MIPYRDHHGEGRLQLLADMDERDLFGNEVPDSYEIGEDGVFIDPVLEVIVEEFFESC